MAEIPVSLSTGVDPSVEYAFRQDTANRMNSIFSNLQAPVTQQPIMPKVDYTVDQILNKKHEPNKDFDLMGAYFSTDPSQRALAQSVVNKGMASDHAFQNKINIPTIYNQEEGADKYLDKDYGFRPEEGIAGNEEFYYQNDYLSDGLGTRAFKNVGRFVGRTLSGAVLKLGQGIGYTTAIFNPANWDSDFKVNVADNVLSRNLEEIEKDVKNSSWLDVYHSADYDRKGLFSKMADATWWTDTTADGAAFLLSAAIPGVGLGKLGQGVAIGNNLTRGGRLLGGASKLLTGSNNIGGVGAWAYNTVSESAFEAASKFKEYKQSLIDDRNNGKNTLTDREIDEQSGHMASNSFLGNLAVLALPNAFENSMVFQKIAGKRSATGAADAIVINSNLTASRASTSATKLGAWISGTSRIPFYGKKGLQALGMEGLWEENAQLAIQRMNDGDSIYNFSTNYFKQLKDAVSGNDTEAAESIALGGILGFIGTGVASKLSKRSDGLGRGERREIKAENVKIDGIINNITSARNGWISNENIYDLDENNKVVFENGQPKVNPEKLAAKIAGMQAIADTMEQIETVNDPDLRNFLSKDLFKEYVKANIEGGTYDKMLYRLSEMPSKSKEELEAFGFDSESPKLTPNQLVDQAQELASTYVAIRHQLNPTNDTALAEQVAPIAEKVYQRLGQNIALKEYYDKLQTQTLENQGKFRNIDNASLSDLFADQYNMLSFKEEALKQQQSQNRDGYYAEKIAEIKAAKKELLDNTLEIGDLSKTSDDFYINDKQAYTVPFYPYMDSMRKMAEIENVIDENNYRASRLMDPATSQQELEKNNKKEAANIVKAAETLTPSTTQTTTTTSETRNSITPEEFNEFRENGNLAEGIIPYIAEKVKNNEELEEDEAIIYGQRAEDIDAEVEKQTVSNPTIPPITAVPPGGEVASASEYKGAVAYLSPLKSVTQEETIDNKERTATVTPYQEWVQTFIGTNKGSRLRDFLNQGNRLFLMKDREEWPNKSTGSTPDQLGVVIVVADSTGNPLYFDKDYNVVPEGNGMPITYSSDLGYTGRNIDEKVKTATSKGLYVNGKLIIPANENITRMIYRDINDELVNKRARLIRNELPPIELTLIDVQANNRVPTGPIRPAIEVFGPNAEITFLKGDALMEVDDQKFVVKGMNIASTDFASNLANLYDHSYADKKTADAALQYIKRVLPESNRTFNNFIVVDEGNGKFRLQVKHSGEVADKVRFRNIVRGNNNKPLYLNIDPSITDFTEVTIKDDKISTKKMSYKDFLRDKLTTNLKGTKTATGGVTYRNLNAYFIFEYADSMGMPIPERYETAAAPTATPTSPVVPQVTPDVQPVLETSQVPAETAPIIETPPQPTQAVKNDKTLVAELNKAWDKENKAYKELEKKKGTVDGDPTATEMDQIQDRMASLADQIETLNTRIRATAPAKPAANPMSQFTSDEIKQQTKNKIAAGTYWVQSEKTANEDQKLMGSGYKVVSHTKIMTKEGQEPIKVKGFNVIPKDQEAPKEPKLVKKKITKKEPVIPPTEVAKENGNEEVKQEPVAKPVVETARPPQVEIDPVIIAPSDLRPLSQEKDPRRQYHVSLNKGNTFVIVYGEENVIRSIRLNPDLKKAVTKFAAANKSKYFVDLRGKSIAQIIEESAPLKVRLSTANTPTASEERMAEIIGRLSQSIQSLFDFEVEVVTDTDVIDKLVKELGLNNPAGFYTNGTVYLYPKYLDPNLAVHEFGHLWNEIMKERNLPFYDRGLELIKGTRYVDDVKKSHPHLTEEEYILEEALTQMIGDKGASVLATEKGQGLLSWLTELWRDILDALGINLTTDDFQDLTLSEYTDIVTASLLYGEDIATEIQIEEFENEGEIITEPVVIPKDVRDSLIEEVKELAEPLTNIYGLMIPADPESSLYEIAFQLHSSESEAQGAINTVGPRIAEIASLLYPDSRPTQDGDISFIREQRANNMESVPGNIPRLSTIKSTSTFNRSVSKQMDVLLSKDNILSDLRKDVMPKMIDAMGKIVANQNVDIKSNKARIINTLSHVHNNKGAVLSLVDTISTSHNLLRDLQQKMSDVLKMPDADDKIQLAYNIYSTTKSFKDIVQLIGQVNSRLNMYEGPSTFNKDYNKIATLLNETVASYNSIQDAYLQQLRPYMASTFSDFADMYKTVETKKDALLKEKNYLEGLLQNSKQRDQAKNPLNLRLKRVNDQLSRLPTKERFIRELTGEYEDIDYIGMQAMARADSGSAVVATAQLMANEVEQKNNAHSQRLANEADTQLRKLRIATGAGTWDIEKAYKPIVRQVEVIIGFKEDGTPIKQKQDILLNEATPKFFEDRDSFDKRIANLQERIGKAQDTEKQKLISQREKIEIERDDFIFNHTDTSLPKEYFDINKLLKEDIGNGRSVNTETHNIFQQIKSVSANIADTVFHDSIKNDAFRASSLNVQLERILSGINEPQDTDAYKIADRLKKAIDLRDKIGYFDLTDNAKTAFEGRFNWFVENTVSGDVDSEIFYKFLQEHANLNSDAIDLTAPVTRVLSSVDAQQTDYSFMDNFLTRQYILDNATDKNGVVIGDRITPENAAKIKQLEEEYAREVSKLSTSLQAEINTINTTSYNAKTVYYTQTLSDKIDEVASTLVSDTVTDEQANILAKEEIKKTQWYKDNHRNDFPISVWTMRFPLPNDPAMANIKAGQSYQTYKLLDQYTKKGRVDNSGKPYIKSGSTEYTDKDYINLQTQNKPYAEFLSWITDFYNKNQLGYDEHSRTAYFLPAMRKTGGEFLSEFARKPVDTVKGVLSDIKLTEQDREANYGDIKLEKIPVRFSGPIDTENQSKDIVGSILMYSHFANRYDRVKKIEPLIIGARDILQDINSNNLRSGKKGVWAGITSAYRYIKGAEANESSLQEAPTRSNTSLSMDILAKEVLYGNFDNDFTIPVFGDANEFTRNVMGIASKGTFFGSVLSPLKNIFGGKVQQFIFSNIKDGAFTYTNWGQAERDFAKYQVDFSKDFVKFGNKSLIGQTLERLQLLQGDITNEFGKRTQWNAAKYGSNWLLQFKNHAEFQIQAVQGMAMLHNKKVKQGDKMISLIDAWELNPTTGNIQLKPNVEFDEKAEFAFSQKAQKYQRVLNGAYRATERTAAERTALGKLLFYMNRYFVPMFTARFRGAYYNIQSGEEEQGFHNTTAKFFVNTLVSYRGQLMESWGDLSAQEKVDVSRSLKEIGIVVSLAWAAAILGRWDTEERKKNTNFENYALGLLIGTYSEARSFIVPADYMNKISSPFFAFRPLNTAISLIGDTVSYLPGGDDPNFTRDTGYWKEGDSRALADALRLMGFTGASAGLFDPTGNDEAAQSYVKNVEAALRLRN